MSLMPTQEDATRVHIIVKKTFLECIPDRRRDEAQSLAGCSEPIIDWSDMAEDESIGSRLHGSGLCKPCAWHWKKGGCKNGAECRHCHKCPKGEVTRRKREARRFGRRQRYLDEQLEHTPSETKSEKSEQSFVTETPEHTPSHSPRVSPMPSTPKMPTPSPYTVGPCVEGGSMLLILVPVPVPTVAFVGPAMAGIPARAS
ncbi:unnamed protein product [Durusdinium trenchii]|uniref:C3H1-type domain-containing protein n=1 Tax=Durusdinium trenchii TaxID=1381693 RepID=A0ABP0PLF7_9DINO